MSAQLGMVNCKHCEKTFSQRKPGQYFCKASCRAAHNRENGIAAKSVSARRLKTRISITLHTTDERVLAAPLGTKWQLVKM